MYEKIVFVESFHLKARTALKVDFHELKVQSSSTFNFYFIYLLRDVNPLFSYFEQKLMPFSRNFRGLFFVCSVDI